MKPNPSFTTPLFRFDEVDSGFRVDSQGRFDLTYAGAHVLKHDGGLDMGELGSEVYDALSSLRPGDELSTVNSRAYFVRCDCDGDLWVRTETGLKYFVSIDEAVSCLLAVMTDLNDNDPQGLWEALLLTSSQE